MLLGVPYYRIAITIIYTSFSVALPNIPNQSVYEHTNRFSEESVHSVVSYTNIYLLTGSGHHHSGLEYYYTHTLL